MKALVTGASSGIGRDIARYLKEKGYELILVSKTESKLKNISKELDSKYIVCDLRNKEEVYSLYEKVKNENIDVLVNNAGFGLFGVFDETPLDRELEMIEVNAVAPHILTKLFLKDFIKKDSGYILNVASSAGFLSGPKLSTYYATKNYILKLTLAISEELKRKKSHVHISALCPGPVDTNFNKIAGGEFHTKSLSSEFVAKYAIDKMLKNKLIIIPGFSMKVAMFFQKFLPTKLALRITYNIQDKKTVK